MEDRSILQVETSPKQCNSKLAIGVTHKHDVRSVYC